MAQEPGRTFIDAETSIEGKISGKDASIAGSFKGEIQLTGTLVLTPSANIDVTPSATSPILRRVNTWSWPITTRIWPPAIPAN